MNIRLFFILLLFVINPTCLVDPFYDEEQTLTLESQDSGIAVNPNANHLKNIAACLPKNLNRFMLLSPFEKLNLIGIVQLDGQFRALFLDEQQRIIDLKSGDFIENEFIHITDIDLKTVHYINWHQAQHCTNPITIQLTL